MFRIIALTLALLLAAIAPSMAAHPDTKQEIENLKERIRALETELGQEPAEEQPFTLTALGKHLSFSGLLELEASYNKLENAEESSDLALATAQLSTEAGINEHVGGHLILLYEEDDPNDESIKVDEAVISLSCPRPLFGQTLAFHGGKMYVPFGKFNSYMVSDPLTLDLGETNDTAALFALEGDTWGLSFGVFNGGTDAAGDDDHIDSLVASLEVEPVEGVHLGASYMSDLAESDIGLVADPALYGSSTPALSGYLSLEFARFGIEAEVLGAIEDFDQALIGLSDLTGDRPLAWNLEAAWMPSDKAQLAARVEDANDFQDDVMRYGATGSYGIFANTVAALEYLYADPETDPRSHTLTAQLAFEF